MNNATKDKIKFLVNTYRKEFPREYKLFKKGVRIKQEMQATKYAEPVKKNAKKADSVIMRALFEMPETLVSLLKLKLHEEEANWLFSSTNSEGARWFAKTFKDFRIAEKV